MATRWRQLITAPELLEITDGPEPMDEFVILDCRHVFTHPSEGRKAYHRGHIPGAVHAHVDDDLSGPVRPGTGRHPLPTMEEFQKCVEAWGITTDTQVVAYDDVGGAFAARAWWLLRHHGHEAVAVLDGGLQAFLESGGRLTTQIPDRSPSEYPVHPGCMPVVTTGQLETQVPATQGPLIDARDPERYRGEKEPIDPVAGHIPGALNIPFKKHLTPDGRFRAPDELRMLYEEALGNLSQPATFYCGSGVTAVHGILAMELAGLPGAVLYPGSWSEWITDPERPVARADPKKAPGAVA